MPERLDIRYEDMACISIGMIKVTRCARLKHDFSVGDKAANVCAQNLSSAAVIFRCEGKSSENKT